MTTAFYENLVELKGQSSEACFKFISQGASATAVSYLQRSPQVARLQAQLTTVFEAIADGRKTTRVYPQPRKSDYDAMTQRSDEARLDARRHAALLQRAVRDLVRADASVKQLEAESP